MHLLASGPHQAVEVEEGQKHTGTSFLNPRDDVLGKSLLQLAALDVHFPVQQFLLA